MHHSPRLFDTPESQQTPTSQQTSGVQPVPSPQPMPSSRLATTSKQAPTTQQTLTSSRAAISKTEIYQRISQTLRDAFPSQKDIEILLGRVNEISTMAYHSNLRSRTTLQEQTTKVEFQLMDLMNPGIHPVLLARKMLIFAAALQYFSPIEEIPGLTEHHHDIMKRLAESAINMVTTNDVLLGTMECLECIILEGFFHVDGGNMRRAWIVFRRATTVAQIMGLHRSDNFLFKVIDPQNNLDPKVVWNSIVYLERTLSLLLGLPSSNAARSTTLYSPIVESLSEDDLSGLQLEILARILERNELGISHQTMDMTRNIDQQLINIAENLPGKFWRPLNFNGLEPDSMNAFWETRRAWDHMCHYSLLNQLHLPYLLSPSFETKNEYSRIACITASREILTRVILFRTFNPITACCRMGDFMALIAGMTLMLAHIVSHFYEEMKNLLVHQRLGDRAIIQQVLECMNYVSKLNEDVLAAKYANLLEQLLLFDRDAAQGYHYRADKTQWSEGDYEVEQKVLFITVPYVGTVRIAREGIEIINRIGTSSNQEQPIHEGITIGGIGSVHVEKSEKTIDGSDGHIQGVVHHINLATTSSSILGHSSTDFLAQENELFPDVAAGLDDWVFQGIDTAFFDNLMNVSDGQIWHD